MFLFADTNILLDLEKIELLHAFFCTKHEICIEESLFHDELIEPGYIKDLLINYGLQCVEMTNEEFTLAQKVCEESSGLSIYDGIAYAVAKSRNWILLTGDRKLKKYAESHGIEVKGLLWTIEECAQNGSAYNLILESLDIIKENPKIRIPDGLVINMKIRYLLRAYRENVKVVQVSDLVCFINGNICTIECMRAYVGF